MSKSQYSALRRLFASVESVVQSEMAGGGNIEEKELNGVLGREASIGSWRNNVSFQKRLQKSGLSVDLDWSHTGREEPRVGSDFIVELDLQSPTLRVSKSILVQAKRLMATNGPGPGWKDTDEYRAFNLAQATKMLDLTPSSYYLLYNPPAVLVGSKPMQAGLSWVAASTLEALGLKTPKYRDIMGHDVRFVDFLMDAFFQTIVGDPRLRIAPGPNGIFVVRPSVQSSMVELIVSGKLTIRIKFETEATLA